MAFKHHISFAIDLASRFGCGRFRIMPDIVSKRLCAAICSIRIWADALLSDKSSIEILHRIRFGIYRIIPMSYFYSETNQRSKDWAKRCALLWSATTSRLRITSNWSLSLDGFQTSHFICNRFGFKIWLWSIPNHARHRFQAFVCRHLFNSNLSRRPLVWQVVNWDLAQDSVRNLQNYSYVIFLLWDQSTIERLSEAMRAALVGNNLSPAHYIENFISV